MSEQQASSTKEGDLRQLAIREARRDGVFAGLTSGLTGALVGSRLMGLNRNKTLFCGVLTGLLSGYLFTQAFEASNISRIDSTAHSALLAESSSTLRKDVKYEYYQLGPGPVSAEMMIKYMKLPVAEKEQVRNME